MKVLLVDLDSKIPNLALMKLSTFYKSMWEDVEILKCNLMGYPNNKNPIEINASGFDKVYVSIVFDVNKYRFDVKGCGDVEVGGTGYDIFKRLPDDIDLLDEDYSLYLDNNSSYGFITRGCIRNCSFCFVPQKEGTIRYYRDWKKIVKHDKTYFLDNNFLSYSDHKRILKELVDDKIKFQFNQGLDIRLLDDENAKLLSEARYIGDYIFAFDNIKYEHLMDDGIKLFKRYIDRDWASKFFIYCHPDMEIGDVLYRIEWCRKNKALPYLMRNKDCWRSENKDFYIDLAAYCNQPGLFKNMDFSTFIYRRYPKNKERAEKNENIYNSAR